jgi:septum formation protein
MINRKIVLASKSPRRKKLLEQIGLDFEILVTDADENIIGKPAPEKYAEEIAMRKAAAAIDLLTEKDALIIGADTIVVLNDIILGKPKDKDDAFMMLSSLSGNTHTVITAIAVIDALTKDTYITHKATAVTFRKLDAEEIWAYIETGSPMDKAGSYGIQDDFGAVFVSEIRGCYYNVVGLPLELLYSHLKSIGIVK